MIVHKLKKEANLNVPFKVIELQDDALSTLIPLCTTKVVQL